MQGKFNPSAQMFGDEVYKYVTLVFRHLLPATIYVSSGSGSTLKSALYLDSQRPWANF